MTRFRPLDYLPPRRIGQRAVKQVTRCAIALDDVTPERFSIDYSGSMPHLIELFVAEHCPGSPDARLRVREFAATREDVVVVERSVDHDLEAARRYGLFATPAVVIDGQAVLYGAPAMAQLAARCDEGPAVAG